MPLPFSVKKRNVAKQGIYAVPHHPAHPAPNNNAPPPADDSGNPAQSPNGLSYAYPQDEIGRGPGRR